MSIGELAITRRISPVAASRSTASASSRSRDSSCWVRRCTSFLSWLSSVACKLFFFFETPSRAMWVPPDSYFGGLSGANCETEADKNPPWSESLVDNEVRCQPRRKPSPEKARRRSSLRCRVVGRRKDELCIHRELLG